VQIADAAFAHQRRLDRGEKTVVGVNRHTDSVDEPLEILRVSHEIERAQVRELSGRRTSRDEERVRHALTRLGELAGTDANLVPPMIEAARAEATLGEICGVLRDRWGGYREEPRY